MVERETPIATPATCLPEYIEAEEDAQFGEMVVVAEETIVVTVVIEGEEEDVLVVVMRGDDVVVGREGGQVEEGTIGVAAEAVRKTTAERTESVPLTGDWRTTTLCMYVRFTASIVDNIILINLPATTCNRN